MKRWGEGERRGEEKGQWLVDRNHALRPACGESTHVLLE